MSLTWETQCCKIHITSYCAHRTTECNYYFPKCSFELIYNDSTVSTMFACQRSSWNRSGNDSGSDGTFINQQPQECQLQTQGYLLQAMRHVELQWKETQASTFQEWQEPYHEDSAEKWRCIKRFRWKKRAQRQRSLNRCRVRAMISFHRTLPTLLKPTPAEIPKATSQDEWKSLVSRHISRMHMHMYMYMYMYIYIYIYVVGLLSGPSLACWGVIIWSKFVFFYIVCQKHYKIGGGGGSAHLFFEQKKLRTKITGVIIWSKFAFLKHPTWTR